MEPCPVCGASGGGAACPLFPAWAQEARVLYFFEEAKRGQPLPPEVRRFWAAAVEHYLLNGQQASLTFAPAEVAAVFTRRAVLRPLCMDRVAVEGDARGETALLASVSPAGYAAFAEERQLHGAAGAEGGSWLGTVVWALRKLVLAPLGAAWSLVAGHEDDDFDDDHQDEGERDPQRLKELREPRVHLGLLKQAAGAVCAHYGDRLDVERTVLVRHGDGGDGGVSGAMSGSSSSSSSSGACTLREVCQAAAAEAGPSSVGGILAAMSGPDCLVLADYLVAQGMATSDGRYLKIVGKGGGGGKGKNGKTKEEITEADKKVLDFRLQVRRLEATLARREAVMLEAKQRAVALHKQGLVHRAAVELAQSKRMGEAVGKLRAAVLNLLTLHYSIEGVAADVAIFEGLKGGNAALTEQRAAAALSVKDVDEAMQEARELVAETVEVSAALAQPMGADGATTTEEEAAEEEAALLKELEALEAEAEQETSGVVATDVAALLLPDVSHLPPPRVVDVGEEEKGETTTTAGKARALAWSS